MATEKEILDFYTFTSRDVNMFSEFPKKFKAYVKDGPFYLTLPSQPYVLPRFNRPVFKTNVVDINYTGSPSVEQAYVFDIMSRRMVMNYHCGLVNMKTGKGKSHIIMGLTTMYKSTTLIMCHNVKTLLEMVEKFKQFTDYEPGVYYGGKKQLKDITITTHDSFVINRGQMGKHFDVIVYDECDFNLSSQMLHSLCLSRAKALYGLTGTPFSKHFNNSDMQKIFGKEIMYRDEMKEEIDTGYNMIPSIETYRYRSDKFKEYEYNNWAEEKQCLMDDKDRIKEQIHLIRHMINRGRKAILILTERVEEAQNYYNELEDLYLDDPHEIFGLILITGQTKIKQDNHSLSTYLGPNFTPPVVIIGTVGKMARGVDIPAIDTILLFCALHFKGTIVQAVGRALRTYPDKLNPLLIDWQDYPLLANQWYQRKAAYKKEYNLKDTDILSFNVKPNGQYES